MFLTPTYLVEPDRRPQTGVWRGLALYLADGVLFGRGMDQHGKRFDGPVLTATDPDCLLVIANTPASQLERSPAPEEWWLTLWHVERAHRAARLGDWKQLGECVDAAHGQERATLAPDAKRDLSYAAARTAGAWGGRPSESGLILVAPPEKHDAIRKAVEAYL